jgi:hypothetical protein
VSWNNKKWKYPRKRLDSMLPEGNVASARTTKVVLEAFRKINLLLEAWLIHFEKEDFYGFY